MARESGKKNSQNVFDGPFGGLKLLEMLECSVDGEDSPEFQPLAMMAAEIKHGRRGRLHRENRFGH
ncbi:MAG: hypothetical protein WCJ29_02170 [bacterium]